LIRGNNRRHDATREIFWTVRARRRYACWFLGKDPESQVGQSPTLFATDRTDRITYIAQGWKVTDPQTLADIGPVPDHETLIEIPEESSRCTPSATWSRGESAESAPG